ncbi:hypothetical protein N7U66_12900 [Lacinutrix neustonica]|uniref:Uncharacterized protein n=1 Tax=Lacinutrix neustonica TaxID=2980107 RepID=A0A9E8SDC6_9FLAO|nr:hypothetical protein [Lacinutrix neustonica]WAC01069.1 hypothetical protein N7U66_12900 [Lacinutrix neustonica]
MKNVVLLVLFIVAVSCKGEAKKETMNKETSPKVEEQTTVVYPKLEGVPLQLNYIFENGFEFAEDIKVNYIALQAKGDNNYQLIYGIDASSDLERIESLKVSANFYAENPKLFTDDLYKEREVRQVPSVAKISILDNEAVISQEFTMVPKEHKLIKFYFYSDQGVENDKMLTLKNIDLPK